jgi:serine/threonine protein kinase
MSDATMEDLHYLHSPDTEPIPGYRLLAPLGRGGFGEVWKCEAPGGLLKAIKFVHGSLHSLDAAAPADEELRAIERVKTVRHPFILSMERVEVVDGELVIVFELADRSLADVMQQQRSCGKPGIPRDNLLAYLREAAEALDVMHVRHGLQHLDVKPQNLFLVCDHVKVGDFGLVQSVSGGSGNVALGAITPLYAAPEVFQGRISSHADQYSLAIVYQELLTGTLPFNGKNSRQLLMQHVQGEPNLEPLPESDRAAVARALSKDPSNRFHSCSELVAALSSGNADSTATVVDLPLKAAQPDTDTRRTPAIKTRTTRNLSTLRPPTAPASAAGLEIGDLLCRTPHAETWNARTGDGETRLVKVLFASAAGDALLRLVALRHPTLWPVEVLQSSPGKLVLATPAGERNLRDAYVESQSQDRSGIPRGRLLGWLRTAAEALDELATQHGLSHLAINPRALTLEGEQLRLMDFGLAQLVWMPAGLSPASLNARYAAPELSAGQAGPAADQFSLAVLYHELTTGVVPAPLPGRKNELSVERLPQSDRAAVARALHPDPAGRFASATELIAALQQAGEPETAEAPVSPSRLAHKPRLTQRAPVVQCGGDGMQARLGTNLTADAIRQRMDGFRQQWNARVLGEQAQGLTYQVQAPASLWQRFTGRQPTLEVALQVGQPEIDAPAGVQVRTEVLLTIQARSCDREKAGELIKALGPLLVESVRQHLRAAAAGRQQERVVWPYTLHVCSILPDGGFGPLVECQGKDVSLNGIGFYLPGQLPGSHLLLHLPKTPQTPHLRVPARVVRVQGCGDGWFEVGCILLPPDELPPDDQTLAESKRGK